MVLRVKNDERRCSAEYGKKNDTKSILKDNHDGKRDRRSYTYADLCIILTCQTTEFAKKAEVGERISYCKSVSKRLQRKKDAIRRPTMKLAAAV